MRPAQLLILFLFPGWGASFAQGTLTLNAGDSYVYEFADLPLQSVDPHPDRIRYSLYVSFQPGSFTTNGAFLAEIFEDSTSDSPLASHDLIYDSNLPVAAPHRASLWSPDAWQDLQGVIRFKMLSGSVTISQFLAQARLPDLGGYAIHGVIVQPVPEPASLSVVGIGLAIFWLIIGKRRFALMN